MKKLPPLSLFAKEKDLGGRKSRKLIVAGLVGLATSSISCQGSVIVIHDLIAATAAGGGTNVNFLGNNVSIHASVISGGTGSPSANHGVSEANSWDADPADNIPWDSAGDLALRSNSTRLEGMKELVDDGVNGL